MKQKQTIFVLISRLGETYLKKGCFRWKLASKDKVYLTYFCSQETLRSVVIIDLVSSNQKHFEWPVLLIWFQQKLHTF